MVTVAGALAKAHSKGIGSPRKPRIHAIHLKEVSERPSTYFFAVSLASVSGSLCGHLAAW